MILSWGVILIAMAYCMIKVLRSEASRHHNE